MQMTFEANDKKKKFLEMLAKYKEASQYEIYQYLRIESLDELSKLDKKKRDGALRKLKAVAGLSVRQIARISGFSVNIVAKA